MCRVGAFVCKGWVVVKQELDPNNIVVCKVFELFACETEL